MSEFKFPNEINPRDMFMLGDVIVNTPLIELRHLQEYLRLTYGVELIIKATEPSNYPEGYAAAKGE
jgi:hypothetical protein